VPCLYLLGDQVSAFMLRQKRSLRAALEKR